MANARARTKKKKTAKKRPRSTRPRVAMPAAVRRTLLARGVMKAYRARPAYQRNDYLGWLVQAKRQDTRDKRLAQMVAELKRGDVYMKMTWRPDRGAA